ncbi:dihydrofolate reductase family protein [Paraferrimonas sp. SM1919]|uniref:dihydrofolate reductase family protein n=1 Tax=Paraferrimonas sp. SM1919 TaxID=2662263 RepID=UPI0013D4BDD6|nr:dihydrofolate reductase family protein [Paraferrimonas sp. SM1919]
MANKVFIATSLDGYIADKSGGVDWLHEIPNPDNDDMGYHDFIDSIDALVMGRNTMEILLSFGIDWPYPKPVFVLSNTLKQAPAGLEDKIFMVSGDLKRLVQDLADKGYNDLYIDGGVTIQNFLKEDLIDEMTITTIPVLLGGGKRLFGELAEPLKFKNVNNQRYLDAIVSSKFVRA